MTDLETSIKRIMSAKENEIIDISDVCSRITLIEFSKTDKGFVSERIFSDGRSLKSTDFNSQKYHKTLSGSKRAFLRDFEICYFNRDGSKAPVYSGEVEVMSLEKYYLKK